MTRQSYQQGYISEPIQTRQGIAFKIRYRVRTQSGKWQHRRETLYGLSGRKAARAVLEQRIQSASTVCPEVNAFTIRGFVETYWRPYLDRQRVKLSTRATYESALKLHILPAFGDSPLRDVIPLQIENFVQSKLKSGLSSKTARNLLVLLQGIFSLALDNDLIEKSPIRDRHKPTVERVEKPVWSPKQVKQILENAPERYGAFFQVLALTGVRAGEILGLQWKHVDLAKEQMHIEQSLWRGQLIAPKTKGSIRTINLGAVLVSALKRHREAAAQKKPNDFVFCKRDGFPFDPDVLRKDVLYPILDRLGIPRPSGASGFHAFRHSVGSFINAQTGNLKLAQNLLGHSTINMTADIYTHVSTESEREAAQAVERAIYGDLFPICSQLGNGNKSAATN